MRPGKSQQYCCPRFTQGPSLVKSTTVFPWLLILIKRLQNHVNLIFALIILATTAYPKYIMLKDNKFVVNQRAAFSSLRKADRDQMHFFLERSNKALYLWSNDVNNTFKRWNL